jgi:hypothetical protein
MLTVIALLWVNYVLSFSTMACAIFDLTSPIRDRSSKNPSSATSVSSLLSPSLGTYGSLLLQRSSTSMFLCVPSPEALFFFGHLFTRFIFLQRHSFDKLLQLL